MNKVATWTAIVVFSLGTLVSLPAHSCSRIFWNTNGQTLVTVRSMDWDQTFNDLIYAYPRGMQRNGGEVDNPAQWTSKYGSVVASAYPYAKKYGFKPFDGATDGVNEKGLAAHILYLGITEYEAPDQRPGINYMRWVSYVLDNFATVKDVVEGMKMVRVVPVPMGKVNLGLHLAVEDASGDSAIFEYIKGKLVIHHGKQYNVMTNYPSFDEQLKLLKSYKSFGGSKPLPGDITGHDRFVRAAYFVKYLPMPKDAPQAVAYAFSAIRNVAVPFGAPYGGRAGQAVYPTWWMSATDITNRIFYFNWVENPNIVWVDLKELNLASGQPALVLDPKNPAMFGDVTWAFTPMK